MPEPKLVDSAPRPEDDTPTEAMLRLARDGGMSMSANIIAREANTPAADDVTHIRIAVIDGVESGTPSYVFSLNGANDPVMREAAARYGAAAPRAMTDRLAAIGNMFKEVSAVKAAESGPPAPPQNTHAPSHAPTPTAIRSKPVVQITFDFGPAGRMVGRYLDVSIQGPALVLVADEKEPMYLPPATGSSPDDAISVIIPGLDAPVSVFSVGLEFQHGGKLFCLLLIDRGETDE